MKHFIFLLFAFLTLIPPNLNAQTCQSNLIQNPGFENGLSNWDGTGQSIATVALAGTKSMKLCQNSTIRQTLPTTAGKNLTFSYKARTETGTGKVLSYIKYLSSSYQPLLTEFVDFSATTTYVAGSVTKLSPANTAWVEVGFFKNDAGCVFVDELCLSVSGGSNSAVTFNCPADKVFDVLPTFGNNGSPCPAGVYSLFSLPTATSTCTQGQPTVTFEGFTVVSGLISIADGSAAATCTGLRVSGGGVAMVNFKATDACGNTAICSFKVTQNIFQTSVVFNNCPANITVNAAQGATNAVVNYTYPTYNLVNCGTIGSVTYTSAANQLLGGLASGSNFPIGQTTVAIAAYCGQVYNVCTFEVTVLPFSASQPDLTLANLNITNPALLPGAILNYKFDLKNIGNAAAAGNYNIKAYISTDNVLSNNDIQDGTVPTGNLAAGQTITQTSGASTIPATLAAGQYFLILKVDADNQITESNEANNILVSTSTFTVQSGGGNCAISNVISTNIPCNDNGTPNLATDDTYSFSMTISNTGTCGTGWTGGIAPYTIGSYGVTYGMGNYPISGGNTVLTIKDNANPAITTTVIAVAPSTCSANVSPKPDLELSLTAAPQSPGQWKNTVLTLTLKNTGTVAATNVAVDFVNQSNVLVSNMLAYVSHIAPASTTFNSWTGFWNVGTVAAGQTLVLTYTGFTKLATQIPIFSQVKTENPADSDSAPGNNTTGNPTEDDEAKVVINVNFLAHGERQEDEEKTFFEKMSFLEDYTLFPNPAGESVSILLNEKATQSHSNTTPSTITFLNQLGKPVYQKTIDSAVLENRVLQVDLNDFSNGLYFVKMETEGQRAVVKRLIVSRMY
jgi:hypothetical protein